jgi:type IV secretion system protein VirD4
VPAEADGPDLAQVVVLGGLGVLAGGSVLVLATGAVAGLLFGGGPPDITLSETSSVLVALPGAWADPRMAWPLPVRDGLPGPVAFYVSLALVLAVAVGMLAIALRVAPQLRPGRARRDDAVAVPGRFGRPGRGPARRKRVGPESTAFATRRDTDDLVVDGPEPGRVILGHCYGRLIATEQEHSVLVVGATRSGKTTGYAIPALLEWDGPAIVLSAKTDLLHATHAARRERGDVRIYDPTKVSGLPGDGWSPLARATDWRGAVRAANAMSKVSGTTSGLGGASNHWERVAAQLLAPMLLAAAHGGLSMGDVVRWVMTKELDETKMILELLGDEGTVARTSLQSYLDLEPRAQDSAFSTVRTVLDAYEDPDTVDASLSWDITPEWLLDGGSHTLYLVANSSDQTRLAPVFLAQLDELLRAAFLEAAQRRARTGKPLERSDGTTAPRLLLLLDEAANIAPIPDLATLASTAGGEGIQLVTIYQDLSQLRHRYGTEWGSIASNHVAKVVLPGVTDPETLAYFSTTVGDEEVLMPSTSSGKDGKRSTSESVQRRPILSQRDLRELPRGQGVFLYGARPPTRFALRRSASSA